LKEAKKELGKTLMNLTNMLFVLYLLGNYLSKTKINFFIVFVILYIVLSFYYIGFYLTKEGSDE